jgi:regulator of nucleoside diphosphate kinase
MVYTPVASTQAISRTARRAVRTVFPQLCCLPSEGEPVSEQKERAVPRLPRIALTSSDYPRLERLARVAAEKGNMDAIFLMGEISRAEILPDESNDARSLVTVGSWVTYWINWGFPPRTVQLVWPEEGSSTPVCIPVLSSLGAALLGLRVGDEMPYIVAGGRNLVRVQNVSRSEPNVIPLFRTGAARSGRPFDDDPGPTAA